MREQVHKKADLKVGKDGRKSTLAGAGHHVKVKHARPFLTLEGILSTAEESSLLDFYMMAVAKSVEFITADGSKGTGLLAPQSSQAATKLINGYSARFVGRADSQADSLPQRKKNLLKRKRNGGTVIAQQRSRNQNRRGGSLFRERCYDRFRQFVFRTTSLLWLPFRKVFLRRKDVVQRCNMRFRRGGAQTKMRWLPVALTLMTLTAADWPQWRGPHRTGISQETGLLKEWPKEGPKLRWQLQDIGDGYSTPAVAGSRLYLLSNRGMDNEFVQALSVEDGKPFWTTRVGNVGLPNQEPPYPMARSTPTVEGDVLYALGSDGDLVCLEMATGKTRWHKNLRADFSGKPGKWAYSESPLIDGDVLIATPGGPKATLVALNKKTGAVIWKSAVPGGDPAAYSSAIVFEAAGRKQYVQFLDKGVVGVDAKTGQFLWRYAKTSAGPANIPTPVAQDGYVYSANARRFGGGLVQLHATPDGVTAEEVYFEHDAPNTLGGQVLLGGYLYGTNQKGPVCAEFVSGKIKWQSEGVGPGAVMYADGRLYIHGEHGDVALIEATPEAYREKGRFTPAVQPKRVRAREMAWTYPVVANGRLYIRDLGTLWCYDVRETKASH